MQEAAPVRAGASPLRSVVTAVVAAGRAVTRSMGPASAAAQLRPPLPRPPRVQAAEEWKVDASDAYSVWLMKETSWRLDICTVKSGPAKWSDTKETHARRVLDGLAILARTEDRKV